MDTRLNHIKKKIYVKAKRRGLLELDLALGYIADHHLRSMNEQETQSFDTLLDVPDALLLKWLLKQEPYPDEFTIFFQMIHLRGQKVHP